MDPALRFLTSLMRRCPNCDSIVDDNAESCGNCGWDLMERPDS